jgi:MFS family permease
VLFLVCCASAAVALAGYFLARENEALLIVMGIFYGGLAFTIYGLSVAHVNDLIDSSRVLEVTGGLLLLYGIGATIGPTLGGAMMDWMGPEALLLYLAGILGMLVLSIWRYSLKFPTILDAHAAKADYVLMGSGSQAVLQMDPRRPQPAPAPATEDGTSQTARP